jgi:hypothetical protein
VTDARIDALAEFDYRAFWTRAMYAPEEKPWSGASDLAKEVYRNRAAATLRAIDAADAEADVIRVDLTDHTLIERVAAIGRTEPVPRIAWDLIRAALRGQP